MTMVMLLADANRSRLTGFIKTRSKSLDRCELLFLKRRTLQLRTLVNDGAGTRLSRAVLPHVRDLISVPVLSFQRGRAQNTGPLRKVDRIGARAVVT